MVGARRRRSKIVPGRRVLAECRRYCAPGWPRPESDYSDPGPVGRAGNQGRRRRPGPDQEPVEGIVRGNCLESGEYAS